MLFLLVAACSLLALPAQAEEAAQTFPLDFGDIVYKGVVGKALDAVPTDPQECVALQRTSAVVSSTPTGRSFALWAGLSNPVLLIAGVVWGLYSASNIRAAEMKAVPVAPPAPTEPGAVQVAELAWPWGEEATESVR